MDFLQFLAAGGILAAVVSAVSVIVQVILNKKLRTPADKTSEITTILTFFKEGIADSRADRLALEGTVKDLREYIAKLESDSRESFSLRVKLEDRIADLERLIKHKDARIAYLEEELARYTARVIVDPDTAVSDVAVPYKGEETE